MAANSPSYPPYIDCAAKGIVLHSIAQQPLSYNTDTDAGLYVGILAHVSVSNPVPVGSTIYAYSKLTSTTPFLYTESAGNVRQTSFGPNSVPGT